MVQRLQKPKEPKVERPKRTKVSAKEALRRMIEFAKRKEKFIAVIRAGKD